MGASKYTGGGVCAELTAPDSSNTAHTPAAAKRNHRSGLSKVGSAKEARFALRLVIVVIFTPIGFSRSGLPSLRLHLEALDHRLGGRISQNFHFGTQVARSIHLIASFAAIQSSPADPHSRERLVLRHPSGDLGKPPEPHTQRCSHPARLCRAGPYAQVSRRCSLQDELDVGLDDGRLRSEER